MCAPRLLEQVRRRVRVKHCSVRTEEGYLHRIKRFVFCHSKKQPRRMGGPQVGAFLSQLAAGRQRSMPDPTSAGELPGITNF